MDTILTSRQNTQVKYLKSLGMAKFRQTEGKYVIEGVRFVEEALEAGKEPALVFSPKIEESERGKELLIKARETALPITWVNQEILEYISATQSPQGVLAVLNIPAPEAFPQNFAADAFYLLVDGVQDPGNLGTIIRSADAAGVSGVLLSKGTASLYNPKVLRATMGSIFHVDIWQDIDAPKFLDQYKDKMQFVAGHLTGSMDYNQVDFTKPTLLIIGSEAQGPEQSLLEKADYLVKIPMLGRAESLNVAVACGVLLFEGVRQKLKKGGSAL